MLRKYYSLDECNDVDYVIEHLNQLQDNSKIYFEILDDEIIKIEDVGLLDVEMKKLLKFLKSNDVVDYGDDYDDDYEDDYF